MRMLTNQQARTLLVRWQGLDGRDGLRGLEGARQIAGRLGALQYDPLNVVGRNADLVLQARVRGYRSGMLEALAYREHFLVDGYDKEMCLYAARDFGAMAPQRAMHAMDAEAWLRRRGQQEAFDMLEDILAIIRQRGPCALKDIPLGESQNFGWGPRRPSGAALEYLFRSGRLCICQRQGTQRYFDLSQRVLSSECFQAPERDEATFADWYVHRRLACVGLLWPKMGGAWQGYVVSNNRARRQALERLSAQGTIVPVNIEGQRDMFYALREALPLAEEPITRRRVRFIAPLDNLLWDRGMVEALFGFRYRWEVYTPANQREYGYYVLPVLYGDRLVARFEPAPANVCGSFRIKAWWWEKGVRQSVTLYREIESAMARFAEYLGVPCDAGNMDAVRRAVP